MSNNPFIYAHGRHSRSYSPGPFGNYSKYKPALQLEYERKCIYCRFPDTVKGYDAFGVEHYRPKSIFPLLETEYSNLFYCCNTCNRRKGDKWPSGIFFPNPDDHVMIDHLRFKGEAVNPTSPSGQFACDVFQLNDPTVVKLRKALLTSLQSLEQGIADLAKVEKAIIKAFKKGEISESERDADLLSVMEQRKEKQDAIDTIAGRA